MADRLAGGNLDRILFELNAAGLSPETISLRLYAEYGIEVTGQTIGNWLSALTAPPPARNQAASA